MTYYVSSGTLNLTKPKPILTNMKITCMVILLPVVRLLFKTFIALENLPLIMIDSTD